MSRGGSVNDRARHRRRQQLARQVETGDGCWFCGVITVMRDHTLGATVPANTATFDHIWSKVNPHTPESELTPRGRRRGEGRLACSECNEFRGLMSQMLNTYSCRQTHGPLTQEELAERLRPVLGRERVLHLVPVV